MGKFEGEIPDIIFLISAIGFWGLAYIQNKKYGKTIETYFLSILAFLFSSKLFCVLYLWFKRQNLTYPRYSTM